MSDLSLTRRQFAQFLLVGGVGLTFCGCERVATRHPLAPQWWIELYADGRIRMLTTRVEMGQGAHTGLRTLVAEELDADPARIEIVQVPSDPRYGTLITGGSYTVAGWQERMRQVAAVARHMLLQVAAQRWRVAVADLATEDAHISHPASGRRAPYGDFVAAAAALEAPPAQAVPLKSPESWRYIGKAGPIAHHADIIAGKARYGIDIHLPCMCFAVLARAPALGARLIGYDDSAARQVAGFIKAIALKGNAWPALDHCRDAVAVVAANSWAAQRAREALQVQWDRSAAANDEQSPLEVLRAHCARPGVVSFEQHRTDDSIAAHRLEAEYQQPYLAHMPMEPPNAIARVMDGRVEVWCGTQRQTRLKDAIVRELRVSPRDVVVHAVLIGGSFGRRLEIDYGLEAAKLASALGRPVQVLWTRSDDVQYSLYRSASVHRLRASLGADGRLSSFEHRFAAESVLRQQEQLDADGADWTLAAPLVALPYEVPNIRLEHRTVQPMAPCAWWRGTYWTNVVTAVECFVDELAQVTAQDPLAFRLGHLQSDVKRTFKVNADMSIPFDPARMRRVLLAVTDHAGWHRPAPAGHARGLACGIYDSPECHAAVVAEMTLREDVPTLVRATVAVDVGTAINPQIVRSQAMGGFVMGASAALREQITWKGCKVEQRGFEDYPILRMNECPPIEVVIVPSDAGMCGVGEIVTPAAIAAVSNAASRLLGRRIRSWPILERNADSAT